MALKDLMARAPAPEPARPEPAPPPPVAASRPSSPAPVQAAATHFGASCVLTGEMRSSEPLRIDGKVTGQIYCEQTLTIGESGSVHAAIEGDTIVIAGEVQGDITARHKITLERTARVTGDLCTPGIVIHEGAKLEGRIAILGGPQAAGAGEPKEAQAAPPAARPPEAPRAPARPQGPPVATPRP